MRARTSVPPRSTFTFKYVAASLLRVRRRVAEKIILVLLLSDLLQSAQQIVAVMDYEAAGAVGQHEHDLLISGGVFGNLRNQDCGWRIAGCDPMPPSWFPRSKAAMPARRARAHPARHAAPGRLLLLLLFRLLFGSASVLVVAAPRPRDSCCWLAWWC